jgi:hypothetical protein
MPVAVTAAPIATIATGATSAARNPSRPPPAIPHTAVTTEMPTAEPNCVAVVSSPLEIAAAREAYDAKGAAEAKAAAGATA